MLTHKDRMKSIFTLFCFLLFFQALTFAQIPGTEPMPAKDRNMALEFSAAYTFALGDYGKTDNGNDLSGYAGNGWLAQVTFDWVGSHHFGLAIQYAYQQNRFRDDANNVYPEGVHDSTYFLGPGKWTNNYLMIGPLFLTTVKKLQVDAKVLIGVMLSSGRIFTTTDPSTAENNANTATGFAFQLSAGLGYAFSKHFAVKANLSYLGGFPSKKRQYGAQMIGYENYKDPVTGIVTQKVVYSAPAEYTIKKVVSTLCPGIGFIYKF